MIRPKTTRSRASRILTPAKLAAAHGGADDPPPPKLKPFPSCPEWDKNCDGILDDDYLMEPSIP